MFFCLDHVTEDGTGTTNIEKPGRAIQTTIRNTSTLSMVGSTPLVKLHRIAQEFAPVEIYAKAEWCNPSGSVKDRAALNMFQILTEERYNMMRGLEREGLFVRISSGAKVAGALKVAEIISDGSILCDNSARYLSEPIWGNNA